MNPPWFFKEGGSKAHAPRGASEREAQPHAHGRVARLRVVEMHPVVGGFGRDADAARDREEAVHAADEAVVALLTADAILGAVLSVEARAGEEAGGTERLGEAVLDHGVGIFDLAVGIDYIDDLIAFIVFRHER